VNAPVPKLQLANGQAVDPAYDDPAVYIDIDGAGWRRKITDAGAHFERAFLSDLELEEVNRREGLGPWAYFGDEPLLFLADPVRKFYRVKGHPMVRKPS
jgi:hypothetical protein